MKLNIRQYKTGILEIKKKGGVFNFVTKRGICEKMQNLGHK
jgi:hypothetical protein